MADEAATAAAENATGLRARLSFLDRIVPGVTRSLLWELLIAALTFPASILISRKLGPHDRGLLSILILITTTALALGSCQWERLVRGQVTSKALTAGEAWRRTKVYAVWLSGPAILGGAVATMLYPGLPWQVRAYGVAYCFVFPLFFSAGSIITICVAAGDVDGQYRIRVATQLVYVVALYGLLITRLLSVGGVMFAYFAMQVGALVVALPIAKNLPGPTEGVRPPAQPLFHGFIPNALEVFSGRIDVWVLSLVTTAVVLGQYAAVSSLLMPVALVSNAVTTGSTARLDWTSPTVIRKHLRKLILLVSGGSALAVVALTLIAAPVLNLVLGGAFVGGAWMASWVAAIAVAGSASTQFHVSLQLMGAQREYLAVQGLDPPLRLIVTLAPGLLFGVRGVLIGFLVASIMKCVACLFLLYRRLNRPVQLSDEVAA